MSAELAILEVDPSELAGATEISMGVFRLRVSLEGQEHEVFALHDGTAIPVDFVAHLYSWAHGRKGTPPPVARKRAAILTTPAPPASGVALVLNGIPLSSTVPPPDVTLYRYIQGSKDHKYLPSTGQLQAGTYLTTELDRGYANSGLASVGRYALPIAFPPDNVLAYVLAGATLVDVGTVLPNFGEAGGGVEVKLKAPTSVIGTPIPTLLPKF